MKKIIASVVLFGIVGMANATEFTGTISTVRVNPSQLYTNNVRVGIQTTAKTACSTYPGWYSYDLPANAISTTWGQALVTAVSNAKSVHLAGTGTCDAYGVEVLSYIDLLK